MLPWCAWCGVTTLTSALCSMLYTGCWLLCVERSGTYLHTVHTYVCPYMDFYPLLMHARTSSLAVQHSERVFRVPSAVTSLSFSTAHPNLLAVSGGRVGGGEG